MQKMGGQTVWCENEKFSGSAPRCIVPPKFLGKIDRDRVRNQEKRDIRTCRANRTMSADRNMPGRSHNDS